MDHPKFTPKTAPAKAKVRRSMTSRIKQAWMPTKYHSQSWLAETGWEITYLYFVPAQAEIFYIVYELVIPLTTLPIYKVYFKIAMSYLGDQQAEVTVYNLYFFSKHDEKKERNTCHSTYL